MIEASSFSLSIYIIVFVIFAVLKALNDKLKKNDTLSPTGKTTASTQEDKDDIPEILKDFFPKPAEVNTKSKPVIKKVSSMPKAKTTKVFIEDPKEEGKRSVENNVSLAETDTSEKDNDYAFHTIEDVRKAIIWSEIINQKY